jgi:hypothetical protein
LGCGPAATGSNHCNEDRCLEQEVEVINRAIRIAQAISAVGLTPFSAAYACPPAFTEATNVQNFPPESSRVFHQKQ